MRKVLLSCAGFTALALIMFARHTINADAQLAVISNYQDTAQKAESTTPKINPVVAELKSVAPTLAIVEVKPGDSLITIAEANQTTAQRIYDANSDISDPSILSVGQKLRIPSVDEPLTTRVMPIPAPKPVTATQSEPITSNAPAVASGSIWDQMSQCEAGGNWARNSGNGYYGGLQFSASTWHGVGGQGLPSENSREEQIARAEILLARSGWGQWPACARKLGLL